MSTVQRVLSSTRAQRRGSWPAAPHRLFAIGISSEGLDPGRGSGRPITTWRSLRTRSARTERQVARRLRPLGEGGCVFIAGVEQYDVRGRVFENGAQYQGRRGRLLRTGVPSMEVLAEQLDRIIAGTAVPGECCRRADCLSSSQQARPSSALEVTDVMTERWTTTSRRESKEDGRPSSAPPQLTDEAEPADRNPAFARAAPARETLSRRCRQRGRLCRW